MTAGGAGAFEAFLIEDVILTLGSVRGALGWLGTAEDCPPAQRAAAFARITRQIGALEDRARGLWNDMQPEPAPCAAESGEAGNIFGPAGGAAELPRRVIFRSRRAVA